MGMYTGGRRSSDRSSTGCGFTRVCLIVATMLMVSLAVAVSLAVYYIMQPDDDITKSETVLSSNVTIEDIVAHVETVKIDPACQTFESEITSKDWKTKDTINADVYYRSIGVGYLTAMSAAYLNPSIKFDIKGHELTQTTSLVMIPDTVQTWRFDKPTKLDNLLLGDYDVVSVQRKVSEEGQCTWQFKYVHHNGKGQTNGLTEECTISIENGNVEINRSSKKNEKKGQTATWIFE